MGSVFERIIASAPVNKAAALAAGGKGETFETTWKFSQEHFKAPPPYRAASTGVELAGLKCGRLTVVGLFVEPVPRKKAARWVVRCQCGDYELRTARALRNPENAHDRCQLCHRTERLRSGGHQKYPGSAV